MTEQELSNRIRQVFDEFEYPGAGEGWKELRRKYPENRRAPLFYWWMSTAAIILLASGLYFLLPQDHAAEALVKQKKNETPVKEPADHPLPDPDKAPVRTDKAPPARYKPMDGPDLMLPDKLFAANPLTLSSDSVEAIPAPVTAAKPIPVSEVTLSLAGTTRRIAPGQLPATDPIFDIALVGRSPVTGLNDSVITRQAEVLAKAEPIVPENSRSGEDEANAASKGSMISMYAGSFFNYAEGSDTKLSFGAGMSSDLYLGKRLKLTAGIGLANNALSFGSGLLPSNRSANALDAAVPSASLGSSNSITTITGYDAKLVNLDIPVNLKYLVLPRSEKVYISAGLSSGTFISEKYTVDYKNFDMFSGAYTGIPADTEVRRGFRTFDLARTLNLSIGFNGRLGKSQSLSIEPFLKYPLGGLGSEQLKFGASGVNLKLNFSTSKKP